MKKDARTDELRAISGGMTLMLVYGVNCIGTREQDDGAIIEVELKKPVSRADRATLIKYGWDNKSDIDRTWEWMS